MPPASTASSNDYVPPQFPATPDTMKYDDVKFREVKLGGHVGFDSLLDQLVNKAVQTGFTFNLLCIGETGVGKTTLMNSLFNTSFETDCSEHTEKSVYLKSNTYDLQESNVRLKLTICDTVGFGDQVNKEDSSQSIIEHIDAQFEKYLQEELKIRRSLFQYHDSRIHACLYFITPNGHGLKSIDLMCMKKLENKVNIIPVIAKADAINKTELLAFKSRIMSELLNNGVMIYQFPTSDETISETNAKMNAQLPFAVVGSNDFVKVGAKSVRARLYPWGVVQVDNENHCDSTKLREMLIRTNMEDLRDTTHTHHYEVYRKQRLKEMGFGDIRDGSSFSEQYTLRRDSHFSSLQQKEELMREKFVLRVKEKEAELKEMERELHKKFDELKMSNSDEKRRLDDESKMLEETIVDFDRRRCQYETERSLHQQQHHSISTSTLGKLTKKRNHQ